MSLRKAILAFLSSGPSSGWDLAREFAETVGGFWYASHGQIYPELRRLEQQGFVASDSDIHDGRLRKRVYRLTDAGWAAVRDWLSTPPEFAAERDLARLQVLFSDLVPPEALRETLAQYRRHYEERRDAWQAHEENISAGTHRRLNMRRASHPDVDAEFMTQLKALVVTGNKRRAEQEIEWAQAVLDWLDERQRRAGETARSRAPSTTRR
jgi:PadR family transcriptional regulator AphA